MPDYIDRNEYHGEIEKCNANNKLSDKAMLMFRLHSREVSNNFFFQREEDREDAMSYAMMDFVRYWKGIKVFCMVEMKLARNFVVGDVLTLNIENYGEKVFIPVNEVVDDTKEFKIGTNANKSLTNLSELINRVHKGHIGSSLHKVKKKINIVDEHNKQTKESNGYLIIHHGNDEMLLQAEIDMKTKKPKNTEYFVDLRLQFVKPSNSFSYLTSLITNALIKNLNETIPKEIRGGKLIHFSQINQDGEPGAYNL